jgi:hypothetical protein
MPTLNQTEALKPRQNQHGATINPNSETGFKPKIGRKLERIALCEQLF